MIEMLGVLAIIGVLSAGGIMGYSTAMENYKVNQTIDDIKSIITKVSSIYNVVYKGPTTYRYSTVDQLYSLGILSPQYYQTKGELVNSTAFTTQYTLKSKMNGKFFVYVAQYSENNDKKAFTRVGFYLFGLSNRACIKLFTTDWNGVAPIGTVIASGYPPLKSNNDFNRCSSYYHQPLTVEQAEKMCTKNCHNGDDNNTIMIYAIIDGENVMNPSR